MELWHDRILVLDFGSQYTQLIARRIREAQVYSQILPCTVPLATVLAYRPKGIVLSGGPSSVYDKKAPSVSKQLFEQGIPILGICYGMQLVTHLQGGEVEKAPHREFGRAELTLDDRSDLFKGIGAGGSTVVWMSHGDRIERMPPGFRSIAHTDNSPIAAMKRHDARQRIYCLQFHPEVAHTTEGATILKNFVYDICGCKPTWTMRSYVETAVEQIRQQVGTERVICALSGGVDSSVAAALTHRAVGDQLTCIFVDNGTAYAFPKIVEAIAAAGHEIGHHGWTHESPLAVAPERERWIMEKGLKALHDIAGVRPRGYRSPAWDNSPASVPLLLEYGFDYDSSMMGSDFEPYWCRVGDVASLDEPYSFGTPVDLVEMPVAWHLDDFLQFEFAVLGGAVLQGGQTPGAVLDSWKAEFDYLHDRIGHGIFTPTMHPQVIGRGHRLTVLEGLIEHVLNRPGGRFTTVGDYCREWRKGKVPGLPAGVGLASGDHG